MANEKKINVEVAYTDQHMQRIIKLLVEEGCTIELAVDRSGILLEFPDIDLMKQKVVQPPLLIHMLKMDVQDVGLLDRLFLLSFLSQLLSPKYFERYFVRYLK